MPRRKTPLPAEPLAYSVRAFAHLIDMSDSGVRGLIDTGAIHAIRIGTAVRIPATELTRLGLTPPKPPTH